MDHLFLIHLFYEKNKYNWYYERTLLIFCETISYYMCKIHFFQFINSYLKMINYYSEVIFSEFNY